MITIHNCFTLCIYILIHKVVADTSSILHIRQMDEDSSAIQNFYLDHHSKPKLVLKLNAFS